MALSSGKQWGITIIGAFLVGSVIAAVKTDLTESRKYREAEAADQAFTADKNQAFRTKMAEITASAQAAGITWARGSQILTADAYTKVGIADNGLIFSNTITNSTFIIPSDNFSLLTNHQPYVLVDLAGDENSLVRKNNRSYTINTILAGDPSQATR